MASTSKGISIVSVQKLTWDNNEDSNSDTDKDGSVDMDAAKEIFYKHLIEYDDQHSGSSRKPWTEERIAETIADLNNIKVTMKKKTVDYYWVGKYDIIKEGNNQFLTYKNKNPEAPTLRIVPREQYFDILNVIHKSCGHGGRDKMVVDIRNKYYIPKKAVEIFVSVCPVCDLRRNGNRTEFVSRSIISRHWNERGELHLIDFQSCPDGEYHWLLTYQNSVTKFIILRPVKSINALAVAYELLTIFLTMGTPRTLLSDLGRIFVAGILEELVAIWPECKIVHEAQDCFQESSIEITALLNAWMSENNSTNWSVACLFVQFYKNASFHRSVRKFPYEELFGRITNTGANTSLVPVTVLSTTKASEQLLILPDTQIINNENVGNSNIKDDRSIKIKEEIEENRTDPSTGTENCETVEQTVTPVHEEAADTKHFKCKSCNSTIYSICGIVEDSQGQKLKVSCYVCKNEQDMGIVQNKVLKRVAEENIDKTSKKVAVYDIGDSVLIEVPKVYRGPMNTKIIRGKIVDFRNNVYRVATNIGTIKNWFSLFDLQRSQTDYGDTLDIPVSLEEAVASQPLSEGEAFIKCNCKPAVYQCHNNRCICYKNKVLCGRNCHSNLSCVNT